MGGSAPEQPEPVYVPPMDLGPSLEIQAEGAEQQAALAGRQLGLSQRQEDIAREQYDRWLDQFKPVEQQLIKEAAIGVDPTRLEARARADQMQQMGTALKEGRRGLVGRGIVSDSPAQRALQADIETAGGTQIGAAQTQARELAEGITDARRAGVFGLGQNIPGEVVSGYGSAIGVMGQAGSAMGGAAAQSAGAAQNIAEAQRQAGLMGSAYQNQLAQQQYQQQLANYQQNQAFYSGIGGLIGAGIGSVGGPVGSLIGGTLGSAIAGLF